MCNRHKKKCKSRQLEVELYAEETGYLWLLAIVNNEDDPNLI